MSVTTKHKPKSRNVATTVLLVLVSLGCSEKSSNTADNCENSSTCPPDNAAGKSTTTAKTASSSSTGGNTSAPNTDGGTTELTGGSSGSSASPTGGTPSTSDGGASNSAATGGAATEGTTTDSGAAGTTTPTPCGANCVAPTPHCNAATKMCVACLTNTDCKFTDPSKPYCTSSNLCVACQSNTDCAAATAPVCDPAMHTCSPCSVDDDCKLIADKHVCSNGTCVQCTGTDYSECGTLNDQPLVCDSLKKTCTMDKTAESAVSCQPCVSDAQCMKGRYCLLEKFNGAEVGYFCFWKQGDTTNGAPANCVLTGQPYVSTPTMTSLDGTFATFCTLAATTCPALNQFRTQNCATSEGQPDDNLCGILPGKDSKCAEYGTVPGAYRCTTACDSSDDCPPGYTCLPGSYPRFCSLDRN